MNQHGGSRPGTSEGDHEGANYNEIVDEADAVNWAAGSLGALACNQIGGQPKAGMPPGNFAEVSWLHLTLKIAPAKDRHAHSQGDGVRNCAGLEARAG